ncbi:FAD:protein FMN transferase [Clostridium manihotivorum]|uniref:FAD:protein FMN transferase n=1 Tax=Clostridium manihotivorum TaxID=2320868 RepID=A0A410DPE8_9CLOT|nr:FAD:protein FMN transferase [Clostridium manihotivorum]QAA30927.1 thiamine biosynthesis protein ApbE [Clostridium manihotivorum]
MGELINLLGGLTILVVFGTLIVIFVTGEKHKTPMIRNSFGLGTLIHLRAYGGKNEIAIDEAIKLINEIDNKMSAFKESSDICRINFKAGLEAEIVSKETFYVLEKAKEYSKLTEGTFDPTIRPLVELWNLGGKQGHIPSKEDIEEKLKLINYKDIILDKEKLSVKLKNNNQKLDLGGIAKGYAADRVRDVLKKYKVKSALIDLGGNIYVLGNKESGEKWNIGIQNPFKERGQYVGVLSLSNKSIVTSGNYEKYFISEGKRYHHILDAKTGFPSESEIVSATIISDDSIDGDGLSTGIYILGVEKSLEILEAVDGIDGVLITRDKKVYVTSGIKKSLVLTDQEFAYEEI